MFSSQSFLRAFFWALIALGVGGCQKPLKVDAEGFGGGGSLDRAQQRIIRQLETYASGGVSGSFCRQWSNCEQTTSQKQCDRLQIIQDDKAKVTECRDFFRKNLLALLAIAKKTRVKTVSNPLSITAPDGSTRSLDALVPKGLQEVWVRESLLSDPNVSDEDLTALLVHEYNHLLAVGPSKSQVGDFEADGGFPIAKDLFDTLGAAIAAESAAPANSYRKDVLKDGPVVFLPMDDRIGSTRLWDIAGGYHDGTIDGNVSFAQKSVTALNTGVQVFASSAIALDPFANDLALTAPVTLEFWFNTASYQRSFGIIAGFDKAALAFQDNILGFSFGDGHIVGTDVTNLAGKWVHIVAKFDPAGITGSQLYLNGALRQLDHTLGVPSFSTGLLSRHLTLNGRPADLTYVSATTFRVNGSYDEVAVYTHALSPERVASHYANSGSKGDTMASRPGFIGDLEGIRDTSAWDEFKCWTDECLYEIGKSSMSDLRQWIGHSAATVYPPGTTEGTTKIQRFKINNLEVGKSYRLLGYVAAVNDSTPYTVSAGAGEVQFLVNTTRSFNVGFYPGDWNMDFVAKKTSVTLTISNGVKSGSSYLSFDAFSFIPLE